MVPSSFAAFELSRWLGREIPLGATGLVINTTVTAGTANSFVTGYPHGVARPNSSNLNFAAGETIPNLVMVRVPANGNIDLANELGLVHLFADASGTTRPEGTRAYPATGASPGSDATSTTVKPGYRTRLP